VSAQAGDFTPGAGGIAATAGGSGVDAVFSALADPTRREVMAALARDPSLTASRLAGELPVTRQAVAKHLATLDRAGLVRARRTGRETRYELTPAPLGDAMAWMAGVGARWDSSLARLAERARE
jgi:ArsR family transcriptional regulator, cadmium/lead-responsive transcriptional repressor